ncbi:hypothetical protein PMAYCL1PPCAC_19960, partial [Pristionchus mayeri]
FSELTLPAVAKINSASVNLDSATVPVSRELLGLSSDFFSTLFYGDFMEKNSGSFRVKEVDHEKFGWFVNATFERKWKANSVDQALSVLHLADRFCMPNVVKRMLPYIMESELSPDPEIRLTTLKQYLDIATRCNKTGEFVGWIFERCESSEELTEVAKSCGSGLTPHLEK